MNCASTLGNTMGEPYGARPENVLGKALCGDSSMVDENGFIDDSGETGLGVDADESAPTKYTAK